VQGGAYQPDRDAGPWLDFCLRAHLEQAQGRGRATRYVASDELRARLLK
jgi:hypothetical protein